MLVSKLATSQLAHKAPEKARAVERLHAIDGALAAKKPPPLVASKVARSQTHFSQ